MAKKDEKAALDSNSSRDSTDAVNSPEDRLAADPALEPDLAFTRDAKNAKDKAKG